MLLYQYIPYFIFHKNETIFPKNFHTYLNECDMIRGLSKKKKQIIFNKGTINYNTPPLHDYGSDCYLDYKGETLWNLRNDTPLYAYEYIKKDHIELWYHTFYPYQLSYRLPILGLNIPVGGKHQADVETVVIHIHRSTKTIKHIILYTHGNPTYYEQKDIQFDNNHPLIYISLISHASYSKEGTYKRICGFANDRCSSLKNGVLWKPNNLVDIHTLKKNHFIQWYRGNLGNDGISSFRCRMEE